jgi:hypothetical protein
MFSMLFYTMYKIAVGYFPFPYYECHFYQVSNVTVVHRIVVLFKGVKFILSHSPVQD